MLLNAVIAVLVFAVQQNNACSIKSAVRLFQKAFIRLDGFDNQFIQSTSIDDSNVDIRYWNSNIGDLESIKINFGREHEISQYWVPNAPLKVIIHGWLDSVIHKDGVFCIKSAYVYVGGFNVISVDWGGIAGNRNYMLPVFMTPKIGARLAMMLDNLMKLDFVKPPDIHLIGHSLGAHIAGVCGDLMRSQGTIGRITGLDPAGPGFEFAKMQNKGLNKMDALFVDIIHTSGGSTGIYQSMGHADFFPNGGSVPQPGCIDSYNLKGLAFLVGCSHSRSYKLYEDSVYHMGSMMAQKCKSWMDYEKHRCNYTFITPLGHGASPKARGDFYLRTKPYPPFDKPGKPKEDL